MQLQGRSAKTTPISMLKATKGKKEGSITKCLAKLFPKIGTKKYNSISAVKQ
jgi:hypothetical protein